jgi:hypothetical protein
MNEIAFISSSHCIFDDNFMDSLLILIYYSQVLRININLNLSDFIEKEFQCTRKHLAWLILFLFWIKTFWLYFSSWWLLTLRVNILKTNNCLKKFILYTLLHLIKIFIDLHSILYTYKFHLHCLWNKYFICN